MEEHNANEVYILYDGECPLCRMGVENFTIPEQEGELQCIDKRTDSGHPVAQEMQRHALNINEGMVVKYQGRFYQGAEALHLMSKLGAGKGVLSRAGVVIFRSRCVAKLLYPSLRTMRNLLLKIKGIPQIEAR